MKRRNSMCMTRMFALVGVGVVGLLVPASAAVVLPMPEGDTAIGQNQDRLGGVTPGTPREAPAILVETGIFPVYNRKGPGTDFIKAGETTRTFFVGQVCPFAIVLPPLPAGAVIDSEWVAWNYLLDGAPPPVDAGVPLPSVNGFVVTGAGFPIGTGTPDLCWGKDGAVAFLERLPVGTLIPGAANGIAGMCDKPVGADPVAYGEGVSLLIVYDIPGSGTRNLDLYHGYVSTESEIIPPIDTATALLPYTNPYQGGDLHFFINALDGQEIFTEEFLLNGILAGGIVAGTGIAGNAWFGLLGPLASNNLYDHANDDISAFAAPGNVALLVETRRPVPPFSDCVGHSFAAVSFPCIDPFCVKGYSKNLCNGELVCGTWLTTFCPVKGIWESLNGTGSTLTVPLIPNPETCNGIDRCDEESPVTVIPDTLVATLDTCLRQNDPCRYRGVTKGTFVVLNPLGVAIARGNIRATIGVGTHRDPGCPQVQFPPLQCGPDCERCYAVTPGQVDPSFFDLHVEGSLEGTYIAGPNAGCTLDASLQGVFRAPSSDGVNIDTPDIANWDFCGTADGVLKCKCPDDPPIEEECIYEVFQVVSDALCDVCPFQVGDQICQGACADITDCVDGISVISPCLNGVGTCSASGGLIGCGVCPAP